MVIGELIKKAEKKLKEADFDNALIESVVLLSEALNCTQSYLYTHSDEVPSADQVKLFHNYLQKRINHMPVAYITGKAYFMSLEFIVDKSVLIPRPETEAMVEKVLALSKENKRDVKVLDMCTGSGCVGISAAYYNQHITAELADKMENCIKIAEKNIKKHCLEDKVTTTQSDMFSEIYNNDYDYILCNPPYIKTGDMNLLMDDVKLYEPTNALDGRDDGLYFYKILANEGENYLKRGGYLILEIGIGQKEEVVNLIKNSAMTVVSIDKDISGIPRIIVAKKL